MNDDFNSRPCVRGDRPNPCFSRNIALFQFTPLREGRRSGSTWILWAENFNSRPCVRGDPEDAMECPGNCEFQFTPLREGRLLKIGLKINRNQISIHAPA